MSNPVTDAIQAALAGEHAAVYAYGVIGGRLDYDSSAQQRASELYETHRVRRDGLRELLAADGIEPVGAEPAYELPVEADDEQAAQRIGQQIEDRCAVLYAAVIAAASGRTRTLAVEALSDTAVAALEWGAPTTALPGVAKP